jgi:polysaccharide deacetylase 2 family uncharacterized protein YibQ
MRSRRFKLPVLSRLAWAWLFFATLGGGIGIFAASDTGRARALWAMAVDEIERLAPPETGHAPQGADARLAAKKEALAPGLAAERLDQPPYSEAEDALGDFGAADYPVADQGGDVVITVDGVPAKAIGEAPRKSGLSAVTPVAAPDGALLRRSAYGRVPRIAADGRRPSKVYAQKFTPGEAPLVALIVSGLGLNRALTERAIDELPPHVTLAFAPYAKDLPFWTKRARDAGHEVMIEIPMENRAGDEAALGPAALLTSRSAEENLQRLDWILARFEGYFGVTNYLGAKYSGDREAMEALLERLKGAGLAYVDDTGALQRLSPGGETATVNRLIDPGFGADKARTKRDLEALETIARSGGDALGKTYVHDDTLAEIAAWALALENRELALAPASAVLAMRAGDR